MWIVANTFGKQWRIESADGRWSMQPRGEITVEEAEQVCRKAAAALSVPASPAGAQAVPVAWLRVEKPVFSNPPRQELTSDPDLAELWRQSEYTLSLTPLYAAPPAVPVAVKPLGWVRFAPSPTGYERYEADTLVGTWWISVQPDCFVLNFPKSSKTERFKTLEAAKSAAQAEHETRIRSALIAPAVPSGKVRYARVKGATIDEMRTNVPKDLWRLGDTVLVWANEGDICFNGELLEAAPAAPVSRYDHEFVADWYRPARCQACGNRREHPAHQLALHFTVPVDAPAAPTTAPVAPVGPEPTSWRCFHCDEVFTDRRCAADHFGADEGCEPACRIKMGAERSLLTALRRAERDAADAWAAIHNETTDAAKAYHGQASRHQEQLRATEELGYERGLRDARALLEAAPAAPVGGSGSE